MKRIPRTRNGTGHEFSDRIVLDRIVLGDVQRSFAIRTIRVIRG